VNDNLKIALSAAVAFGISLAFGVLAVESVVQGYAVVGKYVSRTIVQAEAPVAFYLSISAMFALALALLIAGVVFLSARGVRRERLLAYLNAKVFGVRTGIRWLLVLFLVALAVLVVAAQINRR
jgi:hypothetical protein